MSAAIAPYNWFGTNGERVSVYEDGTLEIQHGEHSYRASFDMWISAAIELNYRWSHCRGDVMEETGK